MIKQIAVEPEVMASWIHFREIWADCGVDQGRLLSEYPKDWREQVCRHAQAASPIKAASICAKLKPPPGQRSPRKWIPSHRQFDKGMDWLNNAEQSHQPEPFHAIVAKKNPRDRRNVLVAGEFNKDQPPWKINTQLEIPRTPAHLFECVKVLLSFSEELILVDPHFDPGEDRFLEPFAIMVASRPKLKPWCRLELHVAYPIHSGKPDLDVINNRKDRFTRLLSPKIPSGNTLQVLFWCRNPQGKRLHPRFIMTEHGGVQYDVGLDKGDSIHDTTLVNLMAYSVWEQARSDYGMDGEDSIAFELGPGGTLTIQGTAQANRH